MLAKDYQLKILSNNKGFSIGRKSKKDFKSFEDAARYFGRLILEWYHILWSINHYWSFRNSILFEYCKNLMPSKNISDGL